MSWLLDRYGDGGGGGLGKSDGHAREFGAGSGVSKGTSDGGFRRR